MRLLPLRPVLPSTPCPIPRPWRRASLTRAARLAAIAVVPGAIPACSGGEAPLALEVDGIGFTEGELVGLSESRRDLLRHLAMYGLTLADSAQTEVLAPLLRVESGNRLHRRLEAERVLAEAGVGDEELRARYLADPEWELTVRHLIVMSPRWESEALRDEARAKAARALERVRAGEAFPEVAAEVSEEPGAEGRQGLLQPGREGAWVDEFWAAASSLEPGAISEVVETQYGFHVLRLEDRAVVPFEEARPRVALAAARALAILPSASSEATRPDDPGFTPEVRTATDPAAVLAAWDGVRVTLADLYDRAAAEGGATWDALVAGDAAERARLLDLELAERAVEARASAAGIRVDSTWIVERARELGDGFAAQGALLGMPARPRRSGVPEAALAALGAAGQNAQLARDQIREWRGLLERRWAPPAGATVGTPGSDTAPDGETAPGSDS